MASLLGRYQRYRALPLELLVQSFERFGRLELVQWSISEQVVSAARKSLASLSARSAKALMSCSNAVVLPLGWAAGQHRR